jgi:hypothetical protein
VLVIAMLEPRRHDRAAFTCGTPMLDRDLREQDVQHHRDVVAMTISVASTIAGCPSIRCVSASLGRMALLPRCPPVCDRSANDDRGRQSSCRAMNDSPSRCRMPSR